MVHKKSHKTSNDKFSTYDFSIVINISGVGMSPNDRYRSTSHHNTLHFCDDVTVAEQNGLTVQQES